MEEKKRETEDLNAENVEITALDDDALEDVAGGPRIIVEATDPD